MGLEKSEEEWLKILGEESYRILRLKGTERPGTGQYNHFSEAGLYVCKACGQHLFTSNTKFDSGCGWPSFYEAKDKDSVRELEDRSHGMHRTEVLCSNCGGHLGHVFPDGFGTPTGLRYCINSLSLDFVKSENSDKS
jgi:peptide-methionine (R)-S-oxide reductase